MLNQVCCKITTFILYLQKNIELLIRLLCSVLCHEGFWQSVPSESIVHIIEDTFLSSTKVIELDNFSYGRFIVVSQDTTVCVFSFPKILHTIHPFLSLNHKSVCFTLPLFNKDRVQFKLNTIDFLSLPASEGKGI